MKEAKHKIFLEHRRSKSERDLRSAQTTTKWAPKLFNAEIINKNLESQIRVTYKGRPLKSSLDSLRTLFNHPLLYTNLQMPAVDKEEILKKKSPITISLFGEFKGQRIIKPSTSQSKQRGSSEESGRKSLSLLAKDQGEDIIKLTEKKINKLKRPISNHVKSLQNIHRGHPKENIAFSKTFNQNFEAFAHKSNFHFLDLCKFIHVEEPSFTKNIPQVIKLPKYHITHPTFKAYHKKLRPGSEERELINMGSNIIESQNESNVLGQVENLRSSRKYELLADQIPARKNINLNQLCNSAKSSEKAVAEIISKNKFEGQKLDPRGDLKKEQPNFAHTQLFVKGSNKMEHRMFDAKTKAKKEDLENAQVKEGRPSQSRAGKREGRPSDCIKKVPVVPGFGADQKPIKIVDKDNFLEEDLMPRPWPTHYLHDSFDDF